MMTAEGTCAAHCRVLVVEDDQNLLDLVSAVLQAGGHSVDTASTSQAALRMACAHEYDVVVLDLILPDTDGIILHGKLKKISPGIASRTIFMTGFTSKEPVIDYLKSLSAEFIHKPFSPEELLRLVEKVG